MKIGFVASLSLILTTLIYIHSKIPKKAFGVSGARAPLLDFAAHFLRSSPSFKPTFIFRRPRRRFERAFSLEVARPTPFWLARTALGASRRRFSRLKCVVFRCFARSSLRASQHARLARNPTKTEVKRTCALACNMQKTIEKRSGTRSKRQQRTKHA